MIGVLDGKYDEEEYEGGDGVQWKDYRESVLKQQFIFGYGCYCLGWIVQG